jgi:hypothetical protein
MTEYLIILSLIGFGTLLFTAVVSVWAIYEDVG